MLKETNMPKDIRVEINYNGQWELYLFLIRGANRPGHYGPAKAAWLWATQVIKESPEKFRVIEK